MRIFTNLEEWIDFRKTLPPQSSLGFAPTMGNLHQGHASLFLKSREDNDFTISSLFVNPTQFNNTEDLVNYPRTLEADLQLMKDSGVDFCLLPDEKSLYADGYTYQVQNNQLALLMEGKHRPGHFNGVLTVVLKLLNLTKPTCAYFGEKDYQQYLLISDMVKSFFMDVKIIPCPTIREESGLACSSRNTRLGVEEKRLAEKFASIFHQAKPCDLIVAELSSLGIKVEYVKEYQGRRFGAVFIGDIRLIDNYIPS